MTFHKSISCYLLLLVICGSPVYGQSHYEISRMDFNTRSRELAPAFYGQGLVFCSDRRNDLIMTYTNQDNNPQTNLYFAEHKKNGKFESPRLLAKELTSFMFEGPSVFSADGKVIYFTRSMGVNSGRGNSRQDSTFGIFTSRYSNGKWSNPSGFIFNSAAYNTGYPHLSDDGSQLFFCSDAPGGIGGMDVYVSTLTGGTWGKPENLGPDVNTEGNEVFPYLQPDGRLYFSSRGRNQKGDLDIYHTIMIDGVWQKPLSMPEPFNTGQDDYGLILNAASDTGYFVSDRDGNPDIFAVYSMIPTFKNCPAQKENDYCYVFYESNNNELDTTTFAYEWDMGDGTIIRALVAEHCFAKPGNYLVQLNIVDKLTKDVMVSQATYNFVVEQIEQPYILCPDTVRVGDRFAMSGRESVLKNFDINNYYWDTGDGTRLQGMEADHSFAFPGSYQIQMGVTGHPEEAPETITQHCVSRRIVVLDVKN